MPGRTVVENVKASTSFLAKTAVANKKLWQVKYSCGSRLLWPRKIPALCRVEKVVASSMDSSGSAP